MNIEQSSKDLIRRHAASLGFDACGVASAEPIDPENRLGRWLRLGYHADMDWMARTEEIRRDITKKLPGARSVVVVARNYFSPRPDADANNGKVSRYAWGRDYHRVMRKPLRALARHIEELGENIETYCSIDSGPVMERSWAARAGVGSIGKNSLALRRDMGSWFFLGTVACTLALEPDAPAQDVCGTCTACIDACPTHAIVEPQVVDSRRCISYQTIENKGSVPDTISTQHGTWVFGCDICQDVCPWNRFEKETADADFHARPGHANPSLDTFDKMNEAEFRDEFSGTPILRATHNSMKRNALIVEQNLRSSK